jgi:hypothetical protein
MTLENVKLVLHVLEEANQTDVGNHWLPEKYKGELYRAIEVMKMELRMARQRQKLTDLLEGRV